MPVLVPEPEPEPEAVPGAGCRVVAVLPEVAAIDKELDYLVPPGLSRSVHVGSVVRVQVGGRRMAGWVVADDVSPPEGLVLKPLARVTGWGPGPELLPLASWAAWRWAGRRAQLLRTASPLGAVRALPSPLGVSGVASAAPTAGVGAEAEAARAGSLRALVEEAAAKGTAIVRLAPASDATKVVLSLVGRGAVLAVVPARHQALGLARSVREAGLSVAVLPEDWAQARAGAAVVVGTRAAVWGPCAGLAAVVVVDAHDESLGQQAAPTWHASVVAAERARRSGVPCVLLSPCPTLEQVQRWPVVLPSRSEERAGWAPLEVVDMRRQDPRSGLWSPRLVELARRSSLLLCVLNRTGRIRLLACASCGEIARCEACQGAMAQPVADGPLVCTRCGLTRPKVCAGCGSSVLKSLRIGVSRARDDLAAVTGKEVAEVTAATGEIPTHGAVVGTEAVLRRGAVADAVVFVDFDQELLAPRYRAGEEALGLLALAARTVGGRQGGGRVMVQTRLPRHPVLEAAVGADPSRLTGAEAPSRRQLG
ncbi:MAG: hypothetical protein ACRDYC_00360, partial [Acidimicrobiales bacterium]